MKRLGTALLALLLLIPAPASADPFIAREGDDRARVRVTHVVRSGGKWLVRFDYRRVRGEPTAAPFEWRVRVDGVRQPRASVGGRKRFVYDILDRRDPGQYGWLAWTAPETGAVLVLLRDTCTWSLDLAPSREPTPVLLGCTWNED